MTIAIDPETMTRAEDEALVEAIEDAEDRAHLAVQGEQGVCSGSRRPAPTPCRPSWSSGCWPARARCGSGASIAA
jgi:hypothetical protein